MSIKKEKLERDIFIAEDGKEFLSEEKAKEYEREFLQRKKNMRYYRVSHSPDLTEGRGFHKSFLVAVEKGQGHQLYVELYCERYIGSRISWVMGVAATANWSISPVNEEVFNNPEEKVKKLLFSDKHFPDYPNFIKTPDSDIRENFYNHLGEKL